MKHEKSSWQQNNEHKLKFVDATIKIVNVTNDCINYVKLEDFRDNKTISEDRKFVDERNKNNEVSWRNLERKTVKRVNL